MRTYAEHQRAVHELLDPLGARLGAGAEVVAVDDALGRVLADDLVSPADLPGFDNSQMDGYAVRAVDLAAASPGAPVRLPIGPTSAAGDAIFDLAPGTASPVMTGAPIPRGADAVVQIEVADPPAFIGLGGGRHDSPAGSVVAFTAPVAHGLFVRPAGSDVAAGELLLPAGSRLGPAQLGVISAAGLTHVAVRRRVRVLLLSTGHELRPPGSALRPGQIHDANTAMLAAALRECGANVVDAVAPDEPEAVRAAIARGIHPADGEPVDLVVTTGGVSAGAFEVVRDALEPLGVEFTKVAIQPGGPQGLGTATLGPGDAAGRAAAPRDDHTDEDASAEASGSTGAVSVPVVSFPGNPVSALVSFELFLRPVLRHLEGLTPDRNRARLRLAHDVVSPARRHQVRRGIIDGDGAVEVGAPSSHLLHAYANATVLVHLPIGVDALPAGSLVDVWRIDD
ncbi:molybdopterin molybdotransferase MoeA [Agromyces sp. H3Y2-19a]|uniref:molybdopterin molybdotransferase MoeA n=1 Tax=Agromyces TaxID=33877 RepID=UPI001E435BB7|nr:MULTISPECIES: molybdopterin molybdotransferase MoeA [Agromyces]MCD5347995.1 molybdopterin molybdotransferase MoeA [Agromyces sp. S2-1-8]MDF0514408.1 molybdopterin molybdotransferase MoeA [Agromyces chromiiresistens]